MLSSVLRSPRAVEVNIAIMRAFVKMRATYSLHGELARKVIELEFKFSSHDDQIKEIFRAIKQLAAEPTPEPEKPPKQVGLKSEKGGWKS